MSNCTYHRTADARVTSPATPEVGTKTTPARNPTLQSIYEIMLDLKFIALAGLLVVIIICTLLAVYLYNRWKKRLNMLTRRRRRRNSLTHTYISYRERRFSSNIYETIKTENIAPSRSGSYLEPWTGQRNLFLHNSHGNNGNEEITFRPLTLSGLYESFSKSVDIKLNEMDNNDV